MFIFRNLFPVVFEANGAGGGPAGAPNAQPVGATGEPQPAAAGQGQPDPNQGNFNWGLFPDVPEDQRGALEPHLRNVQGHVTRVEQQLAPFKPFVDAGYTPQQVQGLAMFADHFSQDPAGAWLAMAKQLQADGVIDNDLDLDEVARIASGTPAQQQQGQPQMQGVDPQLAQYIQGLEQKVAGLEQRLSGSEEQQQNAVSQRLLNNALSTMQQELKKDGWTDDMLGDTKRLARYIAFAGGNLQQALADAKADRSAHLKGFTQETQQVKPGELEVANGGPKAPAQPRTRDSDSWGKSREGAAQFLRNQNRATAQGT